MNWNQMLPELDVFNLNDSLNFYTKLIGFHIVYDRKEEKFVFFATRKCTTYDTTNR